MNQKSNIISIKKSKLSNCKGDLRWSDKERTELESKILRLRKDQIAALFYCVGIKFSKDDIEKVVSDIINNKQKSGHLGILTDEASSKEDLLWWISYFESANK